MSAQTTQTKPIQIVDLPEVTGLKAEGVYNYFTPDETVDESGSFISIGRINRESGRGDFAESSEERAKRSPRSIKLSWVVQDSVKSAMTKQNISVNCTKQEVLVALSRGQVYTEEAGAGVGFDNYIFGAEDIAEELEGFWRRQLASPHAALQESNEPLASGEPRSFVPLDLLTELMQPDLKAPNVPVGRLMALIPPYYGTDKDDSSLRSASSFMDPQKYHYTNGMLNNSYAPMMLRRNCENGVARDRVGSIARYLISVGRRRDDDTRFVTDDEYVLTPALASLERTNTPEDIATEIDVVGYLIEKERHLGGKKYTMASTYVHGKKTQCAYDYRVAYGQKYHYAVRTIAKVRTLVTDFGTGRTYIAEYFIASSRGCPANATIRESKRPDPPCDIRYYYNYEQDNLTITWAPPVNPQRDVKYIQVFRRENTSQPFTLIAHYDFNDSVILEPYRENIHDGTMRKSKVMPTFHIDNDFDKTKSYIYSIVAMDARHISSYYSTQTRVSYDTTNHKLVKEFVSYQGAPKQYPNWYLKENFFSDSIKDSHHSRVKVYFDPDAYTFERSSGEKSHVFFSDAEDPQAKYIFQFINVDRLAEQQVEVKIKKTVDAIKREVEEAGGMTRSQKKAKANRFTPLPPGIYDRLK